MDSMEVMDDEERADAVHRVAQLNAVRRKHVMRLAETDEHKLVLEGERSYTTTWKWLEDNGWIRSTTNGWIGTDMVLTIQFTLDGWHALCILVDQEEEAKDAEEAKGRSDT